MDADVNTTQPCQCELCQPNWFLGRDDNFEAQPVEVQPRQATLEEVHMAKVLASQRLVLN